MLITENYRAEQAALHARGDYGTASLQYGRTVADLLQRTGATSLLDYGCGSKRSLLQALQVPPSVVYEGYDPAIPDYAQPPVPAELVCCIDVLEHIEPSLLDNVLDHLASLCDPYGFFTVHTGPARKVLSDGRNAHLTQQGPDWWLPRFKKRFDVLAVNAIPSGFAIVVRSLQSKASLPLPGPLVLPVDAGIASTPRPLQPQPQSATPGQLVFKYRGHRIVLGAASQAELQRLQAQLKTQSAAIEWLDSMAERPAFLDVGADAGLHSLYAAVARKGLVIAVEPDGVRRSALTENIAANQVAAQVTLLPIPLSDGGQGLSVDQLVASGSVPQPTCIRIGSSAVAAVVLKGAAKALADPRLVGVLIDLQPGTSLDSESSQLLETAGWVLDGEPPADQTMRLYRRRHLATPWARQPSIVHAPTARGRAVLSHVLQRVAAAPVIQEPFPYAVIDDILPADYYAEALEHFPTSTSLRPLSDTGRVNKGAYEERLVVLFNDEDFARMSASQRRFWRDFAGWMYSDVFLNAFVAKFASALGPRLDRILASSDALRVRGDALLVNDQTNYAVGPHTDAPHRLVTFLFYLPKDDSMRDLGTSVYRPKDSNFVCWGGPHHPFEKFEHVRTVEFLPNRLLAFPKTEKSFHGVERIEREGINRPLLINNIRLLNAVTH